MQKHLTFQDEKSSKFWKIETCGKSFTVKFGKIGTSGQTQNKEFESEEMCLKEAEKLVAEKLKKGYVEEKQMDNKSDNNLKYLHFGFEMFMKTLFNSYLDVIKHKLPPKGKWCNLWEKPEELTWMGFIHEQDYFYI